MAVTAATACPHMLLSVQEGWLSSSGTLLAKDLNTVEVSFDKFWVDFGSTKLRPTLAEGAAPLFSNSCTTASSLRFQESTSKRHNNAHQAWVCWLESGLCLHISGTSA